MLAIIFIYFIGKRFYDLAVEYNQNKWLFAILSVVVYYASGVIFGVILALLDLYFEWQIDWDNNAMINFLGLPVGLLAVWGMYTFLEHRWKNIPVKVKDEIQEIGKHLED